MFLDKYDKEKSEKEAVGKIKNSVQVIQVERDRIGGIIEEMVENNLFTNTEIVESVLAQTTLSKNMVKGMVEEHNFNKKYPFLEEKLGIREITRLKKYFKEKEFSEKQKESALRGDLEGTMFEAEASFTDKTYKHQIVLDEENQNLYEECKNIVEEELGRPVRNKTELFSLIMSDFFANNAK